MLQHQNEITVLHVLQGLVDIAFLGEVFAVTIVLHTSQDDMILITCNRAILIEQKGPAQLLLQTDGLLDVCCLDGLVAA